jgi:hypothetical protein
MQAPEPRYCPVMKTHPTDPSANLKSLMTPISTTRRIPQLFRFVPTMMVAFSALLSTPAQDSLTNGLVAYYPFNGNANDESGNGNDGTVIGATLAADRFGSANMAYRFDGQSAFIKAAADTLPSGPRTISLWFRADTVDNEPVLLGYGGGDCGTSFLMGINTTFSAAMVVAHYCDSTGFSVPYATPPTNGWSQWVVTQNDSHISMYLNGTLILSQDAPQGPTATVGTDLAIGVAVSEGGKAPFVNGDVGFFQGLLDDVRIYNRELSPSEVQLLYATERPEAVTSVGGTISGKIWTKAKSPYVVTNDISVATLTIEPGVTVLFQGSYVFEVAGKLIAAGLSNEMITFTRANNSAKWNGIFFNNAPNPYINRSKLVFCNISYSTNSGIRLLNSTPTIANCEIDSNSAPFGGGIWADIGTGDLTIEDTTIANNTAYIDSQTHVGGGGGISVKTYNNQLTLSHCTFTNNNVVGSSTAPGKATGGGISVEGNTALRTCFIGGNKCEGFVLSFVAAGEAYGGGVWSGSGQLLLEGCTIQNNIASVPFAGGGDESAYGGGINVASGSLAMTNCVIAGNNASAATSLSRGGVGGGIGLGKHRDTDRATTASIVNCTIAYNTPSGVAAVKLGGSSATLLNSIVYFNGGDGMQLVQVGPEGSITASYSDVHVPGGLLFPGDGNIDSNPVFTTTTDLHILDGSQCIDAGNPDRSYNDVCFPPSLGNLRNDMGAYGGPGACAWGTEPAAPTISLGGELMPQWGCPGSTALFSVTAQANGGAPTYQWYKDAVILDGQTANTLKLTNLDTTRAGFYSVMISNDFGRLSATQPLYMFEECVKLQVNPNVDCSLRISGPPGTYVLKYTTNIANEFKSWTSLATNTIVGTDWVYSVPDCSDVGYRFYGVNRQ